MHQINRLIFCLPCSFSFYDGKSEIASLVYTSRDGRVVYDRVHNGHLNEVYVSLCMALPTDYKFRRHVRKVTKIFYFKSDNELPPLSGRGTEI